MLPAKILLVEVWDVVDSGSSRLIGKTRTDSDGQWVFSYVPNYDEGGTLDIYFTFSSTSPDEPKPEQMVITEGGVVYQWTTRNSVFWDVPDGNVFVGTAFVTQNSNYLPAMWLLSDAYRSREFVRSQTEEDPIDVAIIWEKDRQSSTFCNDACYIPLLSPRVFIPHSRVRMPDVVVHEIGHRYRHGAMGVWFFGDVLSYFQCRSHGMFDLLYDSRCAFAEGWADYFPLIVNGDHCFDLETTGSCDGIMGYSSFDLEYQGWGDGRPIGDRVEGRVAGALYDVTDDNNEDFDDRWDSFWAVWTVLGDLPPVYTALDFYTSWMGREEWALQAPLTMRFYNNTIEYFKIGLPMVMRAEGSSGIPATPTPTSTPPPTVTPTPFDSPLPTPTSFQSPLATPTPGSE